MTEKAGTQSDKTQAVVLIILVLCIYFMYFSLLLKPSHQSWRIFILASLLPIYGFIFYWFSWPRSAWQKTTRIPRNRIFLVKISLITILICLGLGFLADYLTAKVFGQRYLVDLFGVVFPYQYFYYSWVTCSVFGMSALIWTTFSSEQNSSFDQNLKSLFATWVELVVIMLWVFVLLEPIIPRIDVLFWLWQFFELMFLVPVFIWILQQIETHQRIRKAFGMLKTLIGGFSFLGFYRFFESIWRYTAQSPSPDQYRFVPTVFFSLILTTWAMSAGIVVVGRYSK